MRRGTTSAAQPFEAPGIRRQHTLSGVASRTRGGAPASILEAVLEADFETIACPHLIDEFGRSLRNRYFQERFAAAEQSSPATRTSSTTPEGSTRPPPTPALPASCST